MEDLQNLLEKINREGVEKANAESNRILAAAQAKAESLLKDARAQADQIRATAEQAAKDYAARAEETVRQCARDTLLKIESSVTTLLANLLTKNVDRALGDEAVAVALVSEAMKGLVGPGEIVCGPKLASALQAQLATRGSFTVVLDETFGTGFTVKTENGRVEHAFTGDVVAKELAKRLRPDLAALVK